MVVQRYDMIYIYIYLRGYVDVDLVGKIDNKKSTTRYVFTLGSVVVSWVSQLQKMATISTTKTEYVTATQAYKEIAWLKGLLKELSVGKIISSEAT